MFYEIIMNERNVSNASAQSHHRRKETKGKRWGVKRDGGRDSSRCRRRTTYERSLSAPFSTTTSVFCAENQTRVMMTKSLAVEDTKWLKRVTDPRILDGSVYCANLSKGHLVKRLIRVSLLNALWYLSFVQVGSFTWVKDARLAFLTLLLCSSMCKLRFIF